MCKSSSHKENQIKKHTKTPLLEMLGEYVTAPSADVHRAQLETSDFADGDVVW